MSRRSKLLTARDPRWVVLTEAGDYSIFGRHREPDESDIARVEMELERLGLAGWIAIMSHSAHARTPPELLMVRPLRAPRTPFEDAVRAFRARQG